MPTATLEEISNTDPADTEAVDRMIAEDRVPTYRQLNQIIAKAAFGRDEWAGMPMPIEGMSLAVESRNPWRDWLERFHDDIKVAGDPPPGGQGSDDPRDKDLGDDWEMGNIFYSRQRNCQVVICKRSNGKAFIVKIPFYHANEQINSAIKTLGASTVWSVDAEMEAMSTLAGHISQTAREHYWFTGSFLESSKRSGITYLFRRLRPTIAMRSDPKTDKVRFLAALCLHPIAYYEGSYAGCMVPTDDVIAHLLLMRGDEHLFWRRANQHSIHSIEAGI